MPLKNPSLSEKDQNHLAKTTCYNGKFYSVFRYISQLSGEKCVIKYLFLASLSLSLQGTRNSTV